MNWLTKWFKKKEPNIDYVKLIQDLNLLNQALLDGYLLTKSSYEINKNRFVIWLGAAALQYGAGNLIVKKEFVELMSTNPNIQIQVNTKENGDLDISIIDNEGIKDESDSNNSI